MKQLRVLLLEDSEFDALVLVRLLQRGGYEILPHRVQSLPEFRAAVTGSAWDIILADYNLPGFTGLDALKVVQEIGKDLPFIIVSGGIGEDIAVGAMKAGASDYIMKGNLARLVPAVERELREASSRGARRQAEEALRESELRYRRLWENAPDALLLMDREGKISLANPAVEQIFGYTPTEIMGQNFALFDVRAVTSTGENLLEMMNRGEVHWQTREMIAKHRNGRELFIETSFAEMELHNEHWLVAFMRDVSRRREAEQELKANEEQFALAREIQQRLFPKSAPVLKGYDIAGASYSAEAASGDYFDFLKMPDGQVGLVVGDVTGHGVGPAILMAEARACFRLLASTRDDAGEILSQANRVLTEDVGSERFITVLLATLCPERNSLSFANAGHVPGYILDPEGRVEHVMKRSGIPLGRTGDTKYVTSSEIKLRAGNIAILWTDGIEEMVSESEELFGTERALQTVRENRHRSAEEILQALRRSARDFSGAAPQADDLTMLVVKVLP